MSIYMFGAQGKTALPQDTQASDSSDEVFTGESLLFLERKLPPKNTQET